MDSYSLFTAGGALAGICLLSVIAATLSHICGVLENQLWNVCPHATKQENSRTSLLRSLKAFAVLGLRWLRMIVWFIIVLECFSFARFAIRKQCVTSQPAFNRARLNDCRGYVRDCLGDTRMFGRHIGCTMDRNNQYFQPFLCSSPEYNRTLIGNIFCRRYQAQFCRTACPLCHKTNYIDIPPPGKLLTSPARSAKDLKSESTSNRPVPGLSQPQQERKDDTKAKAADSNSLRLKFDSGGSFEGFGKGGMLGTNDFEDRDVDDSDVEDDESPDEPDPSGLFNSNRDVLKDSSFAQFESAKYDDNLNEQMQQATSNEKVEAESNAESDTSDSPRIVSMHVAKSPGDFRRTDLKLPAFLSSDTLKGLENLPRPAHRRQLGDDSSTPSDLDRQALQLRRYAVQFRGDELETAGYNQDLDKATQNLIAALRGDRSISALSDSGLFLTHIQIKANCRFTQSTSVYLAGVDRDMTPILPQAISSDCKLFRYPYNAMMSEKYTKVAKTQQQVEELLRSMNIALIPCKTERLCHPPVFSHDR